MAIQFQCPSKGCYRWFSADEKPAKCGKCSANLTAAVRKKQVTYRVRVRNHLGKQEVVYAENRYSEAAARKKEQQEVAFRDVYKAANPYRQREGDNWTMKELFEWAQGTLDFMESFVNTQRQKEQSWKTWLKYPISKMKLGDIFPAEYSTTMQEMKGGGHAPRTVNGRFEHLRWALIRAERDMVIDPHVLSVSRRVRLLKVEKLEPVHFTVSQFLTVIKAVPMVPIQAVSHKGAFVTWHQLLDYFPDIFTIAFTAGMRLGEIMHLRWEWITPRFIRLPAWDTLLNPRVPVTKSRSPRVIPLNSFVRAVLDRRVEQRANGFVFHHFSNYAEKIKLTNGVSTIFRRRIIPQSGLPLEMFSFHSTRKSFVTYAADVVPRREYVDVIVGHELEGMRKVYERIPEDSLAQAMDMYDEWLQTEIMRIESTKIEAPPKTIEYKPESGDTHDA